MRGGELLDWVGLWTAGGGFRPGGRVYAIFARGLLGMGRRKSEAEGASAWCRLRCSAGAGNLSPRAFVAGGPTEAFRFGVFRVELLGDESSFQHFVDRQPDNAWVNASHIRGGQAGDRPVSATVQRALEAVGAL